MAQDENDETEREARRALAQLVRAQDLPYSAMSAKARRRLVSRGYAVNELRFARYVSIAPRFQGGIDVSQADLASRRGRSAKKKTAKKKTAKKKTAKSRKTKKQLETEKAKIAKLRAKLNGR